VRLDRYEARTSALMTTLAVAFFVVYGVPVVWADLPAETAARLRLANLVIWLLFALDMTVRIALAEHRWRYVVRNPIDVLTVLLPMLRPLRVLRIFTAGHALLTRRGGLVRTGQAVLLSVVVLITIGSLAVLDAEQDAPGALIASFPDALWWAMTTVTTVGYGDLYPVTGPGRTVAAGLMLVGISVVGALTAGVTAWYVTPRSVAGASSGGPTDAPAGSATAPDGNALAALTALTALQRDGVLTEAEVAAAVARLAASPDGPLGQRR